MLALANLTLKPKNKGCVIKIDSLRFITDNHQPRKNVGKPKHGFFDAGHIDVSASLTLAVNYYNKDTINVSLARCVASDSIAGFHFSDIHLDASINKCEARLQHVFVKHQNTTLSFDSAIVVLPSKKAGRKLQFNTSVINGSTVLKDIARPFAPVLGNFRIPLQYRVLINGTDSTIQFKNAQVVTTDKKLKIDANGEITHLLEKDKLFIRFNVHRLTTNAITAKRIIDQFVVKKFMMRQLNELGAISFVGSFDVLYKIEKFRGMLSTSKGHLGVNIVLNENTKYLTGSVRTKGFRLGQVVKMKDIGDVGFGADFSFDYSKHRTARIRRLRGGKLPIGWINVYDVSASYKKMKMSDISANIKSDGVVAQGRIAQRKKHTDLLCYFTFNNTDSIHKMKIKPGIRLKNMPWQKKRTDEEIDKRYIEKQEKKQKMKAAKEKE